jgi:hypothetical protein
MHTMAGICASARWDSGMRCGTNGSCTWTGWGSGMRHILSEIDVGPGWGNDIRCGTPRIHDGARRGRLTRHISTENRAKA